MCFAPQRRALFRHLNFQSGPTWCVLYILTWTCASRHNGVQFFISHLASWLRTRRFSEPSFRPSGAPNHWKNTVFCDFPTFSRICIFFLLTLSLSTLLSSNLPLLSASSLLCFSSVHIVGSLTSKLSSIRQNDQLSPQKWLALIYSRLEQPFQLIQLKSVFQTRLHLSRVLPLLPVAPGLSFRTIQRDPSQTSRVEPPTGTVDLLPSG